MRALYSLPIVGAGVPLVAATARTVLAARAGAAFGMELREISLSFDGVTAANPPPLVELCAWTGAGAGTATAGSPVQEGGLVIAHGMAATGQNFTVEPTVLTVLETFNLTPNGGLLVIQFPADATPDAIGGAGFAIRVTAAQAVTPRGYMKWFRI